MWTSYEPAALARAMTDEEWALLEPLIPPAERDGNRRHVMREVVDSLNVWP